MAAIPDRLRPFLLAAAFLALPDVSPADSTRAVSRFGEGAPPPARSEHFTVDALTGGRELLGILEPAYSAFIDVTHMPEASLPRNITVVVFPDEGEFRKVRNGQEGDARTTADRIETFRQTNLNNVLVRETSHALFYGAINSRYTDELRWLKTGLANAVLSASARMSPDEARVRQKDYFRRNPPAELGALLGSWDTHGDRRAATRLEATASGLVGHLGRLERGLGLSSLLSSLASGRRMDDAVSAAYPGRFRTLDELYDRWLRDDLGVEKTGGSGRSMNAVQPVRRAEPRR